MQNYWGPLIPEGWVVEPEDRSVGIFGEAIFHDACPEAEFVDEYADPAISQHFVGWLGWGWNRGYVLLTSFTCRECKQTGWFFESDWDPGPEGVVQWDDPYEERVMIQQMEIQRLEMEEC